MSRLPAMLIPLTIALLILFPVGFFPRVTAVAAILLSSACFLLWRRDTSRHRRSIDRPLACWYAALVAFLLLHSAPLPLGATRITGKERFRQNERAAEAIRDAAELHLLESERTSFCLTRNKAGTLRIMLLAIAMFSAGALASRLAPRRKLLCLRWLVLAGALVGAAGYLSLRHFSQGDSLWWIYPVRHSLPGPVACFGGRNHFGAFLVLLSAPALVLAVADLSRRRFASCAFSGLAFVTLTISAIFSLSRATLLAYVVVLVTALVIFLVKRRPWALLALAGLAAAAALLLFALPHQALRERLKTLRHVRETDSYITRVTAWKDSMAVWDTYPVVGAGPNAFRTVYPQHRTTSSSAFMTHAENELVQLLTDTGLAGLFMAAWLAVLLGPRLFRAVRRPPDEAVFGTAAFVALAGAAATACFDFALHTPLYGITLAALTGLALHAPTPENQQPGSRPQRAAFTVLAGCAFLIALLITLVHGTRLRYDSTASLKHLRLPELRRALAWAPTSWLAWYYFGQQCCVPGHPEAWELGERCLSAAGDYDRNNYRLWKRIGNLRLSLGDTDGARAAFRRVRELRWWVPVPDLSDDSG